jgi:hypothetical protein
MQKNKQNRLVYSDFKNRQLTHYKVLNYTFRGGFMQIRGNGKIFKYFFRNLRQKLGGATLKSFSTISSLWAILGGGVIFYESPCTRQHRQVPPLSV